MQVRKFGAYLGGPTQLEVDLQIAVVVEAIDEQRR